MNAMTRVLAIETSCDETAAAVVENGCHLLSNVIASQLELHRRYGGIFPEVASRQHVLAIQPVIGQALTQAGIGHVAELDAVAVTQGPGLVGSLLVGLNAAKGLSFASRLPLLPVNHLEGHVYSNWIRVGEEPGVATGDEFPIIVLIVSGGHTSLLLMNDHCRYQQLGATLDDAAGEAFDKTARLLGLEYPGGPAIQRAAATGDPSRYPLPRPLTRGDEHRFDFSYSGLKTAVLNLTRQLAAKGTKLDDPQVVADIAASLQEAIVEGLVNKTADAARAYGARRVCICGGVSANRALRTAAQGRFAQMDLPLHIPPISLCTDNAGMIGAAAYYRWQTMGDRAVSDLSLDVLASLPLL